jgi:hypothetical protein
LVVAAAGIEEELRLRRTRWLAVLGASSSTGVLAWLAELRLVLVGAVAVGAVAAAGLLWCAHEAAVSYRNLVLTQIESAIRVSLRRLDGLD